MSFYLPEDELGVISKGEAHGRTPLSIRAAPFALLATVPISSSALTQPDIVAVSMHGLFAQMAKPQVSPIR